MCTRSGSRYQIRKICIPRPKYLWFSIFSFYYYYYSLIEFNGNVYMDSDFKQIDHVPRAEMAGPFTGRIRKINLCPAFFFSFQPCVRTNVCVSHINVMYINLPSMGCGGWWLWNSYSCFGLNCKLISTAYFLLVLYLRFTCCPLISILRDPYLWIRWICDKSNSRKRFSVCERGCGKPLGCNHSHCLRYS